MSSEARSFNVRATTEREREIRRLKIEILFHAGYESSLIFFKFQWFGDSIPNEFRGTFLQRESKHRVRERER